MMQEYLIERNQRIKEAQSYENMLEAKRDEKVIRQFREKISQKTKSSQRKGLIRKMSSAAAMALIIFMGGTMYYYVQNDTTVNFKDIVRGAVNTMGKGVKEQVDSTDKEMPSTLDTESEEKETSDSSTIQRATITTEYNSETTTTESPKNSTENTVTQSAGAYQRYIVRKGYTLVSISKRIYGTQTMVKKIKEANGLSNENQIYPGQKFLVPKSIN